MTEINKEFEIVKIAKHYKSVNRKIVKGSIDEICNVLNDNKGYHINYSLDTEVILFGDIDHLESEEQGNLIFTALCEYFGIGDVSKTISHKDINDIGYHWTFNGYYTTVSELKRHMEDFINLNPLLCKNNNINYVDLSIYKNNSLLRLPNQTNLNKTIPHVILNKAAMKNFIFTYIPKNCELLDNLEKEEISKLWQDVKDDSIECNYNFCNGKTKKDYIIALCDILEMDRFHEFSEWCNIGMVIKNEIDDYSVFQYVSKLSFKFNEEQCRERYNSFKILNNEQSKLRLGSLCNWAKFDDEQAYKKINQEFYNQNADVEFTDEEIIDDEEENKIDDDFEGVINDLEAAKKMYKLYNKWVYCEKELYVFDLDSGLWDNDPNTHIKIITKYDRYLKLIITDIKGENKISSRGYGCTTSLMNHMIPFIKSLCTNNDWIKENQATSLGKLLFKNGFLDMRTNVFNKVFDSKIVFFYNIKRNYEPKLVDITYMESIRQRLFENALGKDRTDYFLLSLARGLAGDLSKKMLFGLGVSNAGKSTATNACQAAFGGYVSTFNAGNLAHNNTSQDEAQQLRWAYMLKHKRLLFSNEVKEKIELDGNMIKKLASGGDEIVGRDHGKSETPFTPHFFCIVLANDLPKITPYDDAVDNRLDIVAFEKKFVLKPSNDFELVMDTNLNEEFKTIKFRDAFTLLIINRYQSFIKDNNIEIPQILKNDKISWIGDEDEKGVINKFLEDYDITNDNKDFVQSSYIEQWINDNKLGVSYKKFCIELNRYCKLNNFTSVDNIKKRVGLKTPKCWVGIKLSSLEDDDDKEDALN